MKREIPDFILKSAAGMLEPFGIDLVAMLERDDKPVNAAPLQPLQKRYLTTAEAMVYTGLARCTLSRAEKAGKIAASKLNPHRAGHVLYERASIDRWLESSRRKPGEWQFPNINMHQKKEKTS